MHPPTEPVPLRELFARAGRLLSRRAALYSGATIAALLLQIALVYSDLLVPVAAGLVCSSIVLPMVAAIVYGFGASDDNGDELPAAAIWSRIAERIWAVVVIDLALNMLQVVAAVFGVDGGTSFFFGFGFLLLATILAFAEIHAIDAPGLGTLQLVPQSILASARIALTRVGYMRGLGLVFAQTIPILLAGTPLVGLFLQTALTVPVAALTVVFYRDCLAMQKRAAGD